MSVRPATPADAPEILRVAIAAFGPEDGADAGVRRARFERRIARCLEGDPGGAWVAESPTGSLDGVALAVKREGVWVLCTLAVHPAAQSAGVGRELIACARRYGDDCHGFLIGASEDGRGWRLYSGLGLAMHPAVTATGPVDRSRLPAVTEVRDGGPEDAEACAAIDREVRGGGRPGDVRALLEDGSALYRTADGYALADDGAVRMLAARDERQAEALLWRVLAATPDGAEADVSWISGRQDWAVRVCLAARLRMRPQGPYFAGGRLGPLTPFLPHGALL